MVQVLQAWEGRHHGRLDLCLVALLLLLVIVVVAVAFLLGLGRLLLLPLLPLQDEGLEDGEARGEESEQGSRRGEAEAVPPQGEVLQAPAAGARQAVLRVVDAVVVQRQVRQLAQRLEALSVGRMER